MSMARAVTIILAGGQGSRLYPLTKIRAKPAVPIAGRFRLIDIPISNCIHSGLRKIFILTQFSSESLHRHIFLTYRFDNFSKDFVTILSAQQTLENRDWYQGTADAVRQNLFFLEGQEGLALILSGDHLYRMNYQKFIDFHLKKKADITVAVHPVTGSQAPEFGVMKVDPNGRILSFLEKPKTSADIKRMKVSEESFRRFGLDPEGRTHLASMGIYIFNWNVLKELLEATTFEDFGKNVIPFAIDRKRVYAYFFDGYWKDIGTIASFFKANIDLTTPQPEFNFYDEEKLIFSHPRFLPGSKILSSEVSNSILCEGSIIDHSTIGNSIIGIRSRIGKNCRIERSVIMGADYYEGRETIAANKAKDLPAIGIGPNCEIRNAIIDKNARIGRGVRLVNAKGRKNEMTDSYCIVDSIIVVPKNAVISDGTII
jgi:glucose-1-phosphate adenylyltransferase